MVGIVFRTPKWVAQDIGYRPNLHLAGSDIKPNVRDVPRGGDSEDPGVEAAVAHPRTVGARDRPGFRPPGRAYPHDFLKRQFSISKPPCLEKAEGNLISTAVFLVEPRQASPGQRTLGVNRSLQKEKSAGQFL